MKLHLLTVGGQKEDWLLELSQSYEKKIRPFIPFELERLKPKKMERAESERKAQAESDLILSRLNERDRVWLCDERGEQIDSIRFSKKLESELQQPFSRLVIVIGGAFGSSPELRARAHWTWSLSNLVFNHQIAQAVVLEQIYRAFAIQKGLPYHNV